MNRRSFFGALFAPVVAAPPKVETTLAASKVTHRIIIEIDKRAIMEAVLPELTREISRRGAHV
jgi:hypothetical protein